MLSNREYEILEWIKQHSNAGRFEIINAFDPRNRCNETDRLLDALLASGHLRLRHPSKDILSQYFLLAPLGESALSAKYDFDKAAIVQTEKEQAQSKRNRRHDWGVAIVSAIVGSLLTLLVEHFDELIALFRNLSSH